MNIIGWLGLGLVAIALSIWTDIAFECRKLCRSGNADFILYDPHPGWELAWVYLCIGTALLVVQGALWLFR